MQRQVVVLACLLVGALAIQCNSGWIEGGDGFCYMASSQPSTYKQASEKCHLYGAWLSSVTNAFENAFLAGLASTLPGAWMGVESVKSNIYWTDGTIGSYSNFRPGYSYSGPMPVYMRKEDGFWAQANDTRGFICKMPDPGQAPCYGWSLEPSSGLCYKGVDQYLVESDAEKYCNTQCGNLAYIPNQQVNAFLPHMFCPVCGGETPYSFIGLTRNSDNFYGWTSGVNFDPANSFSAFARINGSAGSCVHLNWDLTWANTECNQPGTFVCYRSKRSSPCSQTLRADRHL